MLEVVRRLVSERTGGMAGFHRCGELTDLRSFLPKREAFAEVIDTRFFERFGFPFELSKPSLFFALTLLACSSLLLKTVRFSNAV
ncbi:hypothetical protein C41B8_08460 [Salinisphaera hydrothermalis C41B8]|uniref:Uncharacterized protein n=1 Tax=Salinisphaera hydrothermalis (strain C41B8) TaxID=1304275 RepID=A0A084IMA0_SALHC|nr:hypothetical protein C41B8_08460 [Salinisphaera hydrothermalis C41B8]